MSQTKERLVKAVALAKETFGEQAIKDDPSMISAILISLAVDEFTDSIKEQNEKLTECIYQSAGHIAG